MHICFGDKISHQELDLARRLLGIFYREYEVLYGMWNFVLIFDISWCHIYRRLLSYYECTLAYPCSRMCWYVGASVGLFLFSVWRNEQHTEAVFYGTRDMSCEVSIYILFKRSGAYILIFPTCYIIHISSAAAYTCCCGWQHNGERLSSETMQWVRLSLTSYVVTIILPWLLFAGM